MVVPATETFLFAFPLMRVLFFVCVAAPSANCCRLPCLFWCFFHSFFLGRGVWLGIHEQSRLLYLSLSSFPPFFVLALWIFVPGSRSRIFCRILAGASIFFLLRHWSSTLYGLYTRHTSTRCTRKRSTAYSIYSKSLHYNNHAGITLHRPAGRSAGWPPNRLNSSEHKATEQPRDKTPFPPSSG